jgi:hypothetical protein
VEGTLQQIAAVVDGAPVAQDGAVPPVDAESRFNLYLSHAFLNTLHAGFQGKLVATNMEARLHGHEADPNEVDTLRAVLGEFGRWGEELRQGLALLGREGSCDPSPDAPILLELTDELHADLLALVPRLDEALARPELAREQEILLATSLGRLAYAREQHVKGRIAWGRTFGPPELARRNLQLLPVCVKAVRDAHGHLAALEEPGATPPAGLRDDALGLPGAFRGAVHDLHVLVGKRRGAMSYGLAGIEEVDARRWRSAGIDPEAAGYWDAHGFTAAEARAWSDAELADPATAGAWRCRGFTLADAVRWRRKGCSVRRAQRERGPKTRAR